MGVNLGSPELTVKVQAQHIQEIRPDYYTGGGGGGWLRDRTNRSAPLLPKPNIPTWVLVSAVVEFNLQRVLD